MSFGTWLALLVAGLVALPLAAHLLRRGRPRRIEFPAARYVAINQPTSQRRSTLQDRGLFALRALGILGLALLGATPFVRCSELTLARPEGASIAMTLVLDDSLSMRARSSSGEARFESAKAAAANLMAQLRAGDVTSLVLAGTPARVVMAPTSDLGAARSALEGVQPSDRGTDLPKAVELARASLHAQPQKHKRLIVLSDFAAGPVPEGDPPVTAPLPSLRGGLRDCGIVSAQTQPTAVVVEVTCSTAAAAEGRQIQLVAERDDGKKGNGGSGSPGARQQAVSVALARTSGPQRLELSMPSRLSGRLLAVLSGEDDIVEDDAAPVARQADVRRVGVVAELGKSRGQTGGASLVEQALAAVAEGTSPQPIADVPGDVRDLRAFAALLVEDPPGFPPETREALDEWLHGGGVLLALLGPSSARSRLGWTFEPLLPGAVHWDASEGLALDTDSLRWLGPEAATLKNIAARGRARLPLDAASPLLKLGRWKDGEPWLVERERGRGIAIVAGLPSNPELSDFALRPGFLALVDRVLTLTTQRAGFGQQVVGKAWRFPAGSLERIVGPSGALEIRRIDSHQTAVPAHAGRYELLVNGKSETRYVRIDPQELAHSPVEPPRSAEADAGTRVANQTDVSKYVALGLLLLFAAELAARAILTPPRRKRGGLRSSA